MRDPDDIDKMRMELYKEVYVAATYSALHTPPARLATEAVRNFDKQFNLKP